jgi:uncharacterized membrane protein (Fun14 family)
VTSELPVEELLFSAGGGFLFGTADRYAIKKVMKIAAVVIGLFVAALAFLSYKGVNGCKMGWNGECYKKRIDERIRTGCSRT